MCAVKDRGESDTRCTRGQRVGKTYQEEVMVFRLCAKILEDCLLPVPLHVVPVLDLTMTNGVVYAIPWSLGICEGFISNEEVEVLNSALCGKVTRLRRNGWPRATRLCSRTTGGDRCREHTGTCLSLSGYTLWTEHSQGWI